MWLGLVAFLAIVASLYGWQTYAQDSRSGRGTERWQLLVDDLQANYRTVPNGTTIYIIDGPWTNPMEQYAWLPSVGRALYTNAVAFDLPRDAYASEPVAGKKVLYLQWSDGRLVPVPENDVVVAH